mmetsp:Transcript_3656/g.8317  ORF Transcript_3656/g.8317 Transcript_3656/m.8317 type:complete len:90 (-) Transcript_3656:88-357(-)
MRLASLSTGTTDCLTSCSARVTFSLGGGEGEGEGEGEDKTEQAEKVEETAEATKTENGAAKDEGMAAVKEEKEEEKAPLQPNGHAEEQK